MNVSNNMNVSNKMNVLKTNNRFSSLLEDNKTSHNVDTRQHTNVSRSNYNKYNYDSKNFIKKIPVHVTINMNDFPVLIERPLNDNMCNITHNYVEKVLQQQILAEPEKVELLPYGWILLAPNTYKTPITKPNHVVPSMENAINSLVKLYNKRKDAYIDLWGDEEYEKVFSFPNHNPEHDYIYFNEEDKENDESSDDEYDEYDDDYYN